MQKYKDSMGVRTNIIPFIENKETRLNIRFQLKYFHSWVSSESDSNAYCVHSVRVSVGKEFDISYTDFN
jgi:hypothetical protein